MSEIDSKQRSSGSFIAAQQAITLLVHFAQVVVLSRILSPADYGVAAMASAVFSLSAIFKDFGFSISTVQAPSLHPQDSSNLFWIGLAISVVAACATLALSPLFSAWFDNLQVTKLMFGYAFVFLLSSLGNQPMALAERDFRFRELALWRIAGLLSGFAVATIFALYGAGPWSIVAFALTVEAVSMVGAFSVSKFRPGKIANIAQTKSHFAFGGTLTLGGFISYATANVDRVLIGGVLGANSLGFYTRAQSLLVLPMSKALSGFKRFNIASLSRLADNPSVFRESITRILRLYLIPCTLFVVPAAAYATDLVALMMGPKWAPVAPLFVILSPFILVQVTTMMCFLAHVTKGDIRGLAGFYAINAVILIGTLAVTVRFGITAVALGSSISGVVLVQAVVVYLAHRRGLMDAGEFIKSHFSNALVAGTAFSLLKGFQTFIFSSQSAWVNLVLGFGLGIPAMIFLYACSKRFRSSLLLLRSEIGNVWRRIKFRRPEDRIV